MKLNSRIAFGAIGLALGVSACQGEHPGPSTAKVVRGSEVRRPAAGPEGFATVGLTVDVGHESSLCTGVLIAADMVLTAGHCAFERGARIHAYFGRQVPQTSGGPGFIAVTGVSMHPSYVDQPRHSDLPENDIAVLKLADAAPVSYHSVALVQDEGTLHRGQSMRVAGYGITERNNDDGTLRYGDTVYQGRGERGTIDTRSDRGASVCDGDSGGPLFVEVGKGWQVAGIVSGNDDPCGSGKDTFASVAYHHSFIEQAMVKLRGAGRPHATDGD